ncbi:hypothetical protein CerSpe_285620 [Prunus speciosa]
MYPVVQRAQTQGRSEERRFGHQGYGTVWADENTWIRNGPKCLNAMNITEAIDDSLRRLQTDYIGLIGFYVVFSDFAFTLL